MKHSIDTTLRLQMLHRPGQIARLGGALATAEALIGEITTQSVGEEHSIREVTVETADEAHTERVIAAVRAVDGVQVLDVVDRAFERHKGGKIHSMSRVELRNLRDYRQIYTPGVRRAQGRRWIKIPLQDGSV